MEEKQNPKKLCRNVFKDGENKTSKSQFTKMWTEMINKIEKGKAVNLSDR